MGCLKLDISKKYESPLRVLGKNPSSKKEGVEFFLESKKGVVDYYPFGSLQPNRHFSSGDYRYGFNGQEMDNEMDGVSGSKLDFGMRIYDSRLGRWLSRDPLSTFFPSYSPYSFALDNPIMFIDEGGEIPWPVRLKFKAWKRRIDSKFGWRSSTKSNHKGIDVNFTGGGNTDLGAPVLATHDAVVKRVQTYDNHGNSSGTNIILEAPDGSFQTVYMHLNGVAAGIENTKSVKEGQVIGYLGGSGKGKKLHHAAHLHYEIKKPNMKGVFKSVNPLGSDGSPLDPQLWISSLPEFTVVGVMTGKERRRLKWNNLKKNWKGARTAWKKVGSKLKRKRRGKKAKF
jgi:RHS repeat-associated protein